MSHYNRHRRDSNHKAIVDGLRKYGATVKDTSQLSGFVDLVVLFRHRVFLIEVKNDKASKSDKELTPMEQKFHSEWREVAHIVETLEEALIVIGISFKKIQ